MYRDDYAAVNFPMLTVIDKTGTRAANMSFIYCVGLLIVSVLPYFLGYNTIFYFVPAAILGLHFSWRTWQFRQAKDRNLPARRVFFISIAYLPAVLAVLVLDRWLLA